MCSTAKRGYPDLPEEPHQPVAFTFPKREYGKTIKVRCSFQRQWFRVWPFLHYDEAQDVVYCHTCVTAFKHGKILASHNAATAFVSYVVQCL